MAGVFARLATRSRPLLRRAGDQFNRVADDITQRANNTRSALRERQRVRTQGAPRGAGERGTGVPTEAERMAARAEAKARRAEAQANRSQAPGGRTSRPDTAQMKPGQSTGGPRPVSGAERTAGAADDATRTSAGTRPGATGSATQNAARGADEVIDRSSPGRTMRTLRGGARFIGRGARATPAGMLADAAITPAGNFLGEGVGHVEQTIRNQFRPEDQQTSAEGPSLRRAHEDLLEGDTALNWLGERGGELAGRTAEALRNRDRPEDQQLDGGGFNSSELDGEGSTELRPFRQFIAPGLGGAFGRIPAGRAADDVPIPLRSGRRSVGRTVDSAGETVPLRSNAHGQAAFFTGGGQAVDGLRGADEPQAGERDGAGDQTEPGAPATEEGPGGATPEEQAATGEQPTDAEQEQALLDSDNPAALLTEEQRNELAENQRIGIGDRTVVFADDNEDTGVGVIQVENPETAARLRRRGRSQDTNVMDPGAFQARTDAMRGQTALRRGQRDQFDTVVNADGSVERRRRLSPEEQEQRRRDNLVSQLEQTSRGPLTLTKQAERRALMGQLRQMNDREALRRQDETTRRGQDQEAQIADRELQVAADEAKAGRNPDPEKLQKMQKRSLDMQHQIEDKVRDRIEQWGGDNEGRVNAIQGVMRRGIDVSSPEAWQATTDLIEMSESLDAEAEIASENNPLYRTMMGLSAIGLGGASAASFAKLPGFSKILAGIPLAAGAVGVGREAGSGGQNFARLEDPQVMIEEFNRLEEAGIVEQRRTQRGTSWRLSETPTVEWRGQELNMEELSPARRQRLERILINVGEMRDAQSEEGQTIGQTFLHLGQ